MIRTIIKAPETLCIYNSHNVKDTYSLLHMINRLVLTENKLVTLDLSGVTMVTAAASVLLFATVNTCQLTKSNPNVIRCIFPKAEKNKQGHRCVVKTGLSRALHSGTVDKLRDLTESQVYFQSATDPNEILPPTVTLLVRGEKLTTDQLELLLTGISEGMLNVMHHAYKNPANDEYIHETKKDIVDSIGERWWQCAWFDSVQCAWTFIICDLGLGIPKTYNYVKENALYSMDPKSAMVDAFVRGNSRFDGSGRGNGSEDMKRPIEKGADERLLVYSGGVRYKFCTGMEHPEVNGLNTSFHGTLIEWTLYSKLGEE